MTPLSAPRPAGARQTEDGFTLVELMLVLVLLVVVSAIVVGPVTAAMRSTAAQEVNGAVQADARRGLERLTQDLRDADPLLEAAGDHVSFRVPSGPGPVLEHTWEFAAAGGGGADLVVRRDVKDASGAIISTSEQRVATGLDPAESEFVYRAADGSELASPAASSEVRTVEVVLVLTTRPASPDFRVSDTVTLRNAR